MPPVRARSLTGWQPDKKRLIKPRLQKLIAPGHPEMCGAPGRANLGPLRPQPDIHRPTRSSVHFILPQVRGEGQAKMPRLPSRYASMPLRWQDGWEGDFRVGQLSVKDTMALVNYIFSPSLDSLTKSFPITSEA